MSAIILSPPISAKRRALVWRLDAEDMPSVLHFAKWYLGHRIPGRCRHLARSGFRSDSDLIQDAVLSLLRRPPPRDWKLTTVVAHAVKWTVLKHVDRLKHSGRTRGILVSQLSDTATEHYFDELLDLREAINVAMRRLTERQRFVISQRFGLDGKEKTLGEVGKTLKRSRELVRHIEAQAIRKLLRTTTVWWQFIDGEITKRENKNCFEPRGGWRPIQRGKLAPQAVVKKQYADRPSWSDIRSSFFVCTSNEAEEPLS